MFKGGKKCIRTALGPIILVSIWLGMAFSHFFIVISEKIYLFKLPLFMTLGKYISTKKLRRIFKSFVNIWKQFMKKFIRIALIEVSLNFVLKYQDSFNIGKALVWLNSFRVIASLIYPWKISKKISLLVSSGNLEKEKWPQMG